jgi:hypothetical protein
MEMNDSDMKNYMRQEMWMERILETIHSWEKLQGVTVPDDIKKNIIKFVQPRVAKGIKKGNLTRIFMQIAISALVYIKMKGLDK